MTTTPNDPYGSPGYGEGESTSALPDYTSEASDLSSGGGSDYSSATTGYTDVYATDDAGSSSGTTQAAKDSAQNVKDTTTQATQQVAETAKEQASQVAGDVKEQAQNLATQARSEVSTQVSSQRDRAADTLRSLSNELRTMAQSSDQSGLGATLARQGADLSEQAASFLSERDPSQLLDEVRSLARRRPAGFLAGAAIAGAVVGRLSRGAMSARSGDDDSSSQSYGYDAYATSSALPAGQYDVYGSQPASTSPAAASGWSPTAAQPAPILNEPYGEQQPPAGYDPGYGGSA
jgi:F0F1-type ATP synthase membrane subunit b/b'